MSVRPSAPVPAGEATRLAQVLAAGLAFGVKREREEPAAAAEAVDAATVKRMKRAFPDLSEDLIELVAQAIVADDCMAEIDKLCAQSEAFDKQCKSDFFWQLACQLREYDHEARTTGYHAMDGRGTAMRWKKQFRKWCGLRFMDGSQLKQAVNELCKNDRTGAGNLEPYGPIVSWDVSKVTDMSGLFESKFDFNQEIGSWNLASVTTVERMFAEAFDFDANLSKWKFPKVTNMSFMFYNANRFTGKGVDDWTFPEAVTMRGMFWGATLFNAYVEHWKFPKATIMDSMFKRTVDFQGRGSYMWEFPEVTNTAHMFEDALGFKGSTDHWKFPKIQTMAFMFHNARAFAGDVEEWPIPDTFPHVNVAYMFVGATEFNGKVPEWMREVKSRPALGDMALTRGARDRDD